jgi:hypothetical protein
MASVTVHPTALDERVACGVVRHTDPATEHSANFLTGGADEHVLAAAAIGWLLTRKSSKPIRRFSTHLLVCSVSTAALPHSGTSVPGSNFQFRLQIGPDAGSGLSVACSDKLFCGDREDIY